MTGSNSELLTTSWTSVQQIVEELRDPVLQLYGASEADAVEQKVDLIKRLQNLAYKCRLASEASRTLQQGGQAKSQQAQGNTPQRTSSGQDGLQLLGSGPKTGSQAVNQLAAPSHNQTAKQQLGLKDMPSHAAAPASQQASTQQQASQDKRASHSSYNKQTNQQVETTADLPIGAVDLSQQPDQDTAVGTAVLLDAGLALHQQPAKHSHHNKQAGAQAEPALHEQEALSAQQPVNGPASVQPTHQIPELQECPATAAALSECQAVIKHTCPPQQAPSSAQTQPTSKHAGHKRKEMFAESELPSAKEAARWLQDTAKSPMDTSDDEDTLHMRGKAIIRFAMAARPDSMPT